MSTALKELETLIGMSEVKEQVDQIVKFQRVSKLRSQAGLKYTPTSNHMVFTGDPGTGKSTAARLIGKAFAELGFLNGQKGDDIPFIEVHQSDICSKYAGEAEQNMTHKFVSAKGGVLFIDEVYAFIDGNSSNNQGEKVVTVMVQLMEDLRDEVMVIIAGYPNEVEQFLNMNPGLRSRFANTVHFPNYTIDELLKIAHLMLSERDYNAEEDFVETLTKSLVVRMARPDFGNARTVRNLIEQSIKRHSVRVSEFKKPTRKELSTLLKEDIPTLKTRGIKEAISRKISDLKEQLEFLELDELINGYE